DENGGLYVALSGDGNNACAIGGRLSATPGPNPCPELADRAGIWRFSAAKPGQTFSEGEHFAIGIRNMTAFRWSSRHKALYGILHDRDDGAGLAAIFHQGAGTGGGRWPVPHHARHRFWLALQLL